MNRHDPGQKCSLRRIKMVSTTISRSTADIPSMIVHCLHVSVLVLRMLVTR